MGWHKITVIALLTLNRLAPSVAYPNAQINTDSISGGGDGGGGGGGLFSNARNSEPVGGAIININGERKPIPIFDGWKPYPINPPASITEAAIIEAPPGFGCFFWYAERDFAPLLSSNDRSLQPMRRYLSQTFYSPQTYVANDQVAPPVDQKIRFPDAQFLTCFTLPDPGSFDNSIGLWLELAGEEPPDRALPTSPSSRTYLLPMEKLHRDEEFGPARGFVLNGSRVERVAIVHSPGPEMSCRIFFKVGGANAYLDFRAGVPLSGPFDETHSIECYKNGQPPAAG